MFDRKKKDWRPDVIVVYTSNTDVSSPVNAAISKRMKMLTSIYRGTPLFFDKFGGLGPAEFLALFLHQAQLARWKKVLLVAEPKETANLAKRLHRNKFEAREDKYLKDVYPKNFWKNNKPV